MNARPWVSRRLLPAYTVYLVLSGASAFFTALIFTVSSVYQVQIVGLNALQLVLVGTSLEVAILLFEIPTGVVADVVSRRLSVIIGIALTGLGLGFSGSIPAFWAVALGQGVWGVGATFLSGALNAWIADELADDARTEQAYLRAAQVGAAFGILGIPVSVLLSVRGLHVPMLTGGALFVVLALWLVLTMPERGFTRTPRSQRETWAHMLTTLRAGVRLVRGQPVLVSALWVALVLGLFSEGWDRLWTAHLLRGVGLPPLLGLGETAWFGLVGVVASLCSIAGAEGVRRVLGQAAARRGRTTALLAGLYSVVGLGIILFALSTSAWLAVTLVVVVGTARGVAGPVYDAWLNRRLRPEVRATVFSLAGQADAVGQLAGGPAVGAVGLASLRLAILTSGLLMTPAPWLVWRARRAEAAAQTEPT